ncbi:MAG: helix-hairpin-helix domain-containing protein [Candidatus Marinimicrobia bacterium]|nr:helix-hairpin-helix domain-containing protein [Candidatus Neomarinimicrobiota bacterium]
MFTKKERNIIVIIALILMVGAVWFIVRMVIKKQRPIKSSDVKMEESFQREDESKVESKIPAEPVNINTAGLMEIEALPYLGIEKSKDIIEYRDKNGPFKTLNELTKVNGIGKKTLEKLKLLITL